MHTDEVSCVHVCPFRRGTVATEPELTWRQIRGRIAGRKSQNPDADVSDDLRDLRAIRLEEQIQRVVNAAPPPTPEQLERLRALLAPPTAA